MPWLKGADLDQSIFASVSSEAPNEGAPANGFEATPRRAIVAATIGNAIEWFDILVFAIFASAIAETFFPSTDKSASLLAALMTFGIAFLVRPLGGVVLGAYADRHGRKSALFVGMMMMMVGTAIMTLTPGVATIGIAAPVLIVIARLLQGFSAGGEFASATTFLAEQDPRRKAYFSSWQFASQGLAMAMAAAMGLVIHSLLDSSQITQWGWRIPFALGTLIGPVALYIRRRVNETREFKPTRGSPLIDALRNQKASMAISLGAIVLCTASIYVILFIPSYAERSLGLDAGAGYGATFLAGLILLLATPWFGRAADRYGTQRICLVAALVLFVIPVPAFALLVATPTRLALCCVQGGIALAAAAYLGGAGAFVTSQFPTENRTTGVSISYNLSVMLFGGMAPAIMTSLIARSGRAEIPGYYVAGAAAISIAALLVARSRQRRLTNPLLRGALT